MDEIEKKISKARIALIREQPFFGYLAMYLKPINDKACLATHKNAPMGVSADGMLWYQPDFIVEVSEDELIATLAHEVMHLVLSHLPRMWGRQPLVWNIACDMCVNQILDENNLTVPKGLKMPSEYEELTAEQIYDKMKDLADAIQKYEQKIFDSFVMGNGKQAVDKDGNPINGNMPSNAQMEQERKQWADKTAEAAAFAKNKGQMPAGLEKLLEMVLGNKRLNWRDILYKMVEKEIVTDFTYTKPSKRSWGAGAYLPSVLYEKAKVWIGIDTSGSVSDEQYVEFVSEILGLFDSFTNVETTIWQCDAKVHREIKARTQQEILDELKKRDGYGGTNFTPFFEKADEEDVKVLVIFTDMMGEFPKHAPQFRTIWVRSGSKDEAPFGEIIDLE